MLFTICWQPQCIHELVNDLFFKYWLFFDLHHFFYIAEDRRIRELKEANDCLTDRLFLAESAYERVYTMYRSKSRQLQKILRAAEHNESVRIRRGVGSNINNLQYLLWQCHNSITQWMYHLLFTHSLYSQKRGRPAKKQGKKTKSGKDHTYVTLTPELATGEDW